MKTKPKWAVVDEQGRRIEIFRLKVTADQSLPRLRLNKREALRVIAI